jgi:hypothetical protein
MIVNDFLNTDHGLDHGEVNRLLGDQAQVNFVSTVIPPIVKIGFVVKLLSRELDEFWDGFVSGFAFNSVISSKIGTAVSRIRISRIIESTALSMHRAWGTLMPSTDFHKAISVVTDTFTSVKS